MTYKPDKEQDDKISLLYQLGYSTRQVARRLGIKHGAVQGSLRRTNTPIRSISEGTKLRRHLA